MVEVFEFMKSCFKLYSGYESRNESFDFINTFVLWFQPYFALLFISIWYFLISHPKVSALALIWEMIKYTLASFLAIFFIHISMKSLGGIGKFSDMYKFGLSIWFLPSLFNLIFYLILIITKSEPLSFIFGTFLSIIGVSSIIVSILIYGKIQNLSLEYSILGLFIPIIIFTIILFLLRLTF